MAQRIGKYKVSKREKAIYEHDVENGTFSALDVPGNCQFGTDGTSTLGFYGATKVDRPTAITQTYSTAVTTHAVATALAPPAGGTGATAGAYDSAANRNLMITSVTALRTDFIMLQGVVNKLIDDLQELGLIASS
jgi:hypothetical protein